MNIWFQATQSKTEDIPDLVFLSLRDSGVDTDTDENLDQPLVTGDKFPYNNIWTLQ